MQYADEQVTTGPEAEAYASFIDGHLAGIAGGATYAEIDDPAAGRGRRRRGRGRRAGRGRVAELQADADEVTGQRDACSRARRSAACCCRRFAWSTIGRIAGIAAIVAFVAAAVMLVLVVLGLIHRRRTAIT